MTGYETPIGYVDIKSSPGVYFFVSRDSFYNIVNTPIKYQEAQLNIGNGMDLASGVFTAPVSGRYQFNFVALVNADRTDVIFRLNGGTIVGGWGQSQYDTLAITATLDLKKNDRIDTYLVRGSIYDDKYFYYTQFTGILLEEDLVLS